MEKLADKIADGDGTTTDYNVYVLIELALGESEGESGFESTTEWYGYKHTVLEAMKVIMGQFPEIKMEVEGLGEEHEDWWIAIAENGKIKIKYAVVIPPAESGDEEEYEG